MNVPNQNPQPNPQPAVVSQPKSGIGIWIGLFLVSAAVVGSIFYLSMKGGNDSLAIDENITPPVEDRTTPQTTAINTPGTTVSSGPTTTTIPPFASIWVPRESKKSWSCIKSSADGSRLAACVYGGQIYTSSDGGISWIPRESDRYWSYITMNTTGTRILATVENGKIYESTNSGETWAAITTFNKNWSCITITSNATTGIGGSIETIVLATVWGGSIYMYKGGTWTDIRSYYPTTSTVPGSDFFTKLWWSIAATKTGKCVVCEYGGKIHTSTNFGINWTSRDSARLWNGVSISEDGTKMAAVVEGGQIYTSNNSGESWIARDIDRNWYSIAMNSDGTIMAAVVSGGKIYISTDSGVTWSERETSRNWYSITMNSSGTKIAVVDGGTGPTGYIYTMS